jgi:Tol biopolymer transport system component
MKKLSILIFSFISVCVSAQAQKSVLTPEILMSLGRISEIQPSADGSMVLFAVRKYNLEGNSSNNDLYVLNVASNTIKQITNTNFSEFNARWIIEDTKIAYISSESGSSQIWICDKDGLDRKQASAIPTGVNLFEFDKTSRKLFFTSDIKINKTVQEQYPDLLRTNARIIDGLAYRHWNAWEDESFSHVFIADFYNETLNNVKDIMEGEAFDAPLMPFGGNEQIAWSPDGKKLAYTCKKLSGTAYATSTNSDIYLYNTEDNTTKNISEYNKGYDTEPRFSPDGTRIAWLSMERDGYEADKNRIFVLETFNYDNKAKDYTLTKP